MRTLSPESGNAHGAPARLPALVRLACSAGLAAACVLTTGTVQAQDARAMRLVQEAQQRYEQRDLGGAVVQLKNALRLDPRHAPTHVLLGRALLDSSDLVGAEVALREALRLGADRGELVVPLAQATLAQGKREPLLQDALFSPAGLAPGVRGPLLLVLAQALADLGRKEEALQHIEQAQALAPDQARAWLAEVPIRVRARQFEQAASAAQRAVALAKQPLEQAEAHYLLGSVAHAQSRPQQARQAYARALALHPRHLEALLARAGLALDEDERAQARADIEAVRRHHPREPRAQYLLALLAEREGDKQAARKALQAVAELIAPVSPSFLRHRPQLLLLAGLAHHGLGEFEKARPYLEALQREQPASPAAKLLGQTLLAENQAARAAEVLENYLRAQPGDAAAIELLAAAHMALGRPARATQLVQDALAQRDDPQLRTLLGLSLARAGRAAEALAPLETAYRRNPQNLAAGIALVQLHMQAQRNAAALAVADSLARHHPGHAGLQQLLGQARLQAGDQPGARRALEQALRLQPGLVSAELQLARMDAAAGQPAPALQRLQLLLRQDERQPEVLNALAEIEESRGRIAQATSWLHKAAAHAGPRDLQPLLNLFDHHMRQRRYDAAQETAARLETRAPQDPRAAFASARAALALQNPETARAALAKASRLADASASAQGRIALLQLSAGDARGARDSLAKALREDPADLQTLALMVDAEIALGEFAAAQQRARGIAERHPRLAVGHALLGDLAMARGQRSTALEAYRQALKLQPEPAALLRLFRAQAAQDPRGAVQLATQWLARNPNDDPVRQALGDLHASRGDMAAARQAYAPLLQRPSPPAALLNNYSHVLLALGEPAAAQRTAEAALAVQPGTSYVLGTAGWAAFHNGQRDLALQRLREARQRDPANADTRYFLAHVLAHAGRQGEAREELQAALATRAAFQHMPAARSLLESLH